MSIKPRTPRPLFVRRGTRPAALLLLLFAFTTPDIAAQQEHIDSPYRWLEKGFRVGLWGGYHAANRGTLKFGQGPAAAIGAKLRARISSPMSFEIGMTYAGASRWVVDPRVDTGPAIIDTVSAHWLRFDMGTQIGLTGARTWRGIHPYGLAGAGLTFGVAEGASETFADPQFEPFRYDIHIAPHIYVGGGIEMFTSETMGIGFEIRDYINRLSAPDGFLLPGVLANIETNGFPAPQGTAWQHNVEFGIAIWHYF